MSERGVRVQFGFETCHDAAQFVLKNRTLQPYLSVNSEQAVFMNSSQTLILNYLSK